MLLDIQTKYQFILDKMAQSKQSAVGLSDKEAKDVIRAFYDIRQKLEDYIEGSQEILIVM